MFRNVPKFLDVVELGLLEDVKKYIVEKYDVNTTDEYGRSAAIIAAGRNDFRMLKILFDAGADLNIQDSFGNTPLTKAKKNENLEMINFICEKLKNNNFLEIKP